MGKGKTISISLLIGSLVTVAVGLGIALLVNMNKNKPSEGPQEDPQIVKFNSLFDLDYTEAKTTVVTVNKESNDSLHSNYIATNLDTSCVINYDIEQFTYVDIESGHIPDNYIEHKKGQEKMDKRFDIQKYKIRDFYFSQIKFSDGLVEASANNGNKYIDTDETLKDFKLSINYSKIITKIYYEYTVNRNYINMVTIDLK